MKNYVFDTDDKYNVNRMHSTVIAVGMIFIILQYNINDYMSFIVGKEREDDGG